MIDGRSNSMTVMYSDVLRIDRVLRRLTDADKDIKQLSRINQLAIYAAKYRNLQYAFDFLVSCTEKQREERTKSTDKNRKYKSIFQYTSTKEGYIKPKKVQDFSGRSVIVADPDLSVDEVRLPKEMADVIMEYLTKIKPEKNQSLDEVIKHVSVVINRAVTLHRISLRGYKVKISDNNSIGVNPLSAEGFDFDHDGDTMAVHNGLFDVKRNLFIPASGKATLMPKQELVCGLNIISSYKNPIQNENTVEINDDEGLIAAFENYDVSVYENVKYNSVNKTLGEHLIDFIFPHDIVPLCKDIKKNTMKLTMENLSM